MGIFTFLYYAYNILTEDMKYGLGNTEKEIPSSDEEEIK
jgi:hypothetical protein